MTFPNLAPVSIFEALPIVIEGPGRTQLKQLFLELGCRVHEIESDLKGLYHAGIAIACNYLVVLLERSRVLLEAAGLSSEYSLDILEPIVKQTVENAFGLGTEAALTGPVVRGDLGTVSRHIEELEKIDAGGLNSRLYRQLGIAAVELGVNSDRMSVEAAQKMLELLSNRR